MFTSSGQENLLEFQKEVANLHALRRATRLAPGPACGRHERLIQLIGIACEMPMLCIVTELAVGGSLHDLLHVKRAVLQEATSGVRNISPDFIPIFKAFQGLSTLRSLVFRSVFKRARPKSGDSSCR